MAVSLIVVKVEAKPKIQLKLILIEGIEYT